MLSAIAVNVPNSIFQKHRSWIRSCTVRHVKTDKLTQIPLTFYSLTFNLFNDCLGRIKPVLKYKGKENLHKLLYRPTDTLTHIKSTGQSP